MSTYGKPLSTALVGSDDLPGAFSRRPVPQHNPGPDGHGRGNGIAGAAPQAGQPQPLPENRPTFPGVVAGKKLPGTSLGSSSDTARQGAAEDRVERLVQVITDKIVQATSGGQEAAGPTRPPAQR